jgi:hypothetical protein
MFGTDGDSPPGIDERYQAASNTSDLRVEADHRGAGDVLIAAGWSQSRLGMALLRLHSEWTKAQPKMFSDQHVTEHAATLPPRKGKPDTKRAREELQDAYVAAVRTRAERIRGREAVEQQLLAWAMLKGIDSEVVRPTLTHWLAPKCPVCLGRGKRRHADAPVLAGECGSCHGSGDRPRPLGSGQVYGYIEDAVNKGRHSLKMRLRPQE